MSEFAGRACTVILVTLAWPALMIVDREKDGVLDSVAVRWLTVLDWLAARLPEMRYQP